MHSRLTMKTFFANCTIALLVLTLAGCPFGRPKGSPLEELSNEANFQESYQVRRGDTLLVKVWGEPQLSGDVQVRQDGRFTMPLLNDVEADNKSVVQISGDVEEKLGKYIPNVKVNVSVLRTAPIRYYLNGLFAKPGGYSSDTRITLIQAIATGGGFQPFADRSALTLIRQIGGAEKRYVLSYDKVIDGKEPNPELKDGDVVSAQ